MDRPFPTGHTSAFTNSMAYDDRTLALGRRYNSTLPDHGYAFDFKTPWHDFNHLVIVGLSFYDGPLRVFTSLHLTKKVCGITALKSFAFFFTSRLIFRHGKGFFQGRKLSGLFECNDYPPKKAMQGPSHSTRFWERDCRQPRRMERRDRGKPWHEMT